MLREILIIGIGGQGALTVGEILLYAAKNKNYGASFYPFYGSQMRGGESGCVVKIDTSGRDVLNPTINSPNDFILLSDKFFDKYKRFASENSKYYQIDEMELKKYIDIDIRKNFNILILKKYVKQSMLFTDGEIIEAIKEKFKKETVYNSKINVYNDI